ARDSSAFAAICHGVSLAGGTPRAYDPGGVRAGAYIIELGSAADLCVKRLVLNGASVFGEFRAGRCDSELLPLIRCSQCDDTNRSIAYSREWARGRYKEAANGTLTYTNEPGASARLTFDGTALR